MSERHPQIERTDPETGRHYWATGGASRRSSASDAIADVLVERRTDGGNWRVVIVYRNGVRTTVGKFRAKYRADEAAATYRKRYDVPFSKPEIEDFRCYFDAADEIDGGLTLDDLDDRFVAAARRSAERTGLPWPPSLADAEEYELDHVQEWRGTL